MPEGTRTGRDEPRAVREGEELDAGRLGAWLTERLGVAGPLEVDQFPRGYSNLTYRVRTDGREYVLRRPPFGSKVATAHDMSREFRILSDLHPVFPRVPRPIAICEDEAVLGAPFYLMERVRGVILRPRMGQDGKPSPETMAEVAGSLVDTLAELHAVDVEATGLGDFGRPGGYVRRQVEGWTKRWNDAKTGEIPDMDRVARWLADRLPPESGVSLIHNDYKYDNLVLDPGDLAQVVAVLDWEMATVGDPLMDLGTTLGYWIHPGDPEPVRAMALSPSSLPGNPGREEILHRYASATGRDPGDGVFYYAYGLFKIAGIVQQIYFRFRKGWTKDPRFATLGAVVTGCAATAARAIEKGRLDGLY